MHSKLATLVIRRHLRANNFRTWAVVSTVYPDTKSPSSEANLIYPGDLVTRVHRNARLSAVSEIT